MVGGSRKGIAPFLSKITGIHAKNGPFSMVLVAGDLFSDLDTEKDVEQLLNGDIKGGLQQTEEGKTKALTGLISSHSSRPHIRYIRTAFSTTHRCSCRGGKRWRYL